MDGPSNLKDEIIRFNRNYRPGDGKAEKVIERITRNVEKSINVKGRLGNQDDSDIDLLMRNIRISDADLIDSVETELFQKYDVSYSKKLHQSSVNDLPIWRECLPVGTQLAFTLTLDKRIETLSSIQSVKDILAVLDEQTQRTLQLEDANLLFDTSEYRSGIEVEANLILGGGTGFTSKTLLNELIDDNVEAAKFINNSLNINFKQRKHRGLRRGQTLAPETLKVVQVQPNQYVEMGLCKLEIE